MIARNRTAALLTTMVLLVGMMLGSVIASGPAFAGDSTHSSGDDVVVEVDDADDFDKAEEKGDASAQVDLSGTLHEDHQGTVLACDGQAVLHFVLNQVTEINEEVSLTAEFEKAGLVTVGPSHTNEGTIHFTVSVNVEGSDTLETASVTGANGMLVLSDVTCITGDDEDGDDQPGEGEIPGADIDDVHLGTSVECPAMWHFVLNQVSDAEETVTLTATFELASEEETTITVEASEMPSAVLHFNVEVDAAATLTAASVTGANGMLVLSDVTCITGDDEDGDTEVEETTTVMVDADALGTVLAECVEGQWVFQLTGLDSETPAGVLNAVFSVEGELVVHQATGVVSEGGTVQTFTIETGAATLVSAEVEVEGQDGTPVLVLADVVCITGDEKPGEDEDGKETAEAPEQPEGGEAEVLPIVVTAPQQVTPEAAAPGTDVLGAGLTAQQQQTETLPFTGRDVAALAALGLLFLVAGLFLQALGRRGAARLRLEGDES